MKFRVFLATAFLLTQAGAALAAPETLTCRFSKAPSFMPDAIEARYDVETGAASVGAPGDGDDRARAKVVEYTNARLVLNWDAQVPDRRGTYAKLDFRLVHFKKNDKGLLRVDVIGFTNQYNARGTCKTR